VIAIGVSTWLWTSPLDDRHIGELAPWIAGWGFDLLESPIEDVGDWDEDGLSCKTID
jgi:D-psicose/D-tagatose/L-ribulose 3-epimerase